MSFRKKSMIFKNGFLTKSLSTSSFEIVLKKNPAVLIVIVLKYREEFIYGYNFMNNTIKEKLFFYGNDFLRDEQKPPKNCTEYPEDSKNIQKILNIA